MKSTNILVLISAVFLVAVFQTTSSAQGRAGGPSISANTGIYLPQGDPVQGRKALLDLKCNTCHRIVGENSEPRVEGTLGPDLGKAQAAYSKEQLATSIIAPSHNVASIDQKWRSGDVSRMGDFNQAMTVRQLIDLVAYLKSLKR
jgi:hypothetical protein